MLRKANQKRSLDDLVIQKGEFDWRSLFGDEAALAGALGEFEDTEDAHAAAVAAREEVVMEGADEADFGGEGEVEGDSQSVGGDGGVRASVGASGGVDEAEVEGEVDGGEGQEEDEGGSTGDYMVAFVARDYEYFRDWRL
jgi:helicase SWR1